VATPQVWPALAPEERRERLLAACGRLRALVPDVESAVREVELAFVAVREAEGGKVDLLTARATARLAIARAAAF